MKGRNNIRHSPRNPKGGIELKTWDDVDILLREMGEIDIELQRIAGEATIKINEIKETAMANSEGLQERRREIEEAIKEFCEDRKAEFSKHRSKEMTFGTIAYRVVHKIVIRSKEACLKALKSLGLQKYIRVTEEPDKEMMFNLDEDILVKIGAKRKVEDRIRIEPALEKIRGMEV